MKAGSFGDSLHWTVAGTELLASTLTDLTETSYSAPSALPGWSRKHLVAHVIGNAVGLMNLVHWATTGQATPMYESMEQRAADIEAGAALSGAELTERFAVTAASLAHDLGTLRIAPGSAEVVTAKGDTVPATSIPWLRAREVMVHSVDMGTGITFADLPPLFLRALGEDIVAKRSAEAQNLLGAPALRIECTDSDVVWHVTGAGAPVAVVGSLGAVVAYLSGRGNQGLSADSGAVPELPAWL